MPTCGVCGFESDHGGGWRMPGISRTAPPGAAHVYLRCPRCASFFLFPLPSREANAAFEGEDAQDRVRESDALRESYFERRLRSLEEYLRPAGPSGRGRRLLEIGCASGRLLSLARRSGWEVEGVEMSAALARAARELNPGCAVHEGDFLEIAGLPPRSFDAIICLDVLEHVLAPGAMLRRVADLLKPGGAALFQTPNARSLRARFHGHRWNMLIPEYHFHLFSPAALARLLEQSGFREIQLRTASGTGRERGAAALAARAKDAILSSLRLGNALLALARKP